MPIERSVNGVSNDNHNPNGQGVSNLIDSTVERNLKESSMDVRPDRVTEAQRDLLDVKAGEVVFNTETESNEYWNGSEWSSGGGGSFAETTYVKVFCNYVANTFTTTIIDDSSGFFSDGSGVLPSSGSFAPFGSNLNLGTSGKQIMTQLVAISTDKGMVTFSGNSTFSTNYQLNLSSFNFDGTTQNWDAIAGSTSAFHFKVEVIQG